MSLDYKLLASLLTINQLNAPIAATFLDLSLDNSLT